MEVVRWRRRRSVQVESSGGGQVEKSRWRVQAENPGGEEPEKRSGQAEEASMSLRRRCRLATVRPLVYE